MFCFDLFSHVLSPHDRLALHVYVTCVVAVFKACNSKTTVATFHLGFSQVIKKGVSMLAFANKHKT